jgi:hypothetical protein
MVEEGQQCLRASTIIVDDEHPHALSLSDDRPG